MIYSGAFFKDRKEQRIYKVVQPFTHENEKFAVVEVLEPTSGLSGSLKVFTADWLKDNTSKVSDFMAGRVFGRWEAANGHQD